jgi:ComF family protein
MEKIEKIIRYLFKFLKDILFPPICVNCRRSIENQDNFLCSYCFDEIEINSSFYCPKCMSRLAENKCVHQTSYILACATRFQPPIPSLIYAFKYSKLEKIGNLLSAILITYLKILEIDLSKYVVTFVPLHPAKERVRGFNQSQILAETICNYFSCPKPIEVIKRVKNNPPQAKIRDYSKRVENVSECFEVNFPEKIAGKDIIIVDDVSTSGATLNEISMLLKRYGARKIIGLVVAKA